MGARHADLWYSLRLAEPFASMAQEAWGLPADSLDRRDLSRRRLRIGSAHELLADMAERLHDPTIGLRAGSAYRLGDAGAIDYVMRTAPTVSALLEVGARYMRLINDALEVRVTLDDVWVTVELDSRVMLPEVAEDFMVSALYHAHIKPALPQAEGVECRFRRRPPADDEPYRANFAPATVRFAVPSSGYRFPRAWMDAPLPTAEAKLHEILVEQAEQNLAALPSAKSATERVRKAITSRLPRGGATIADVAEVLKMSQRTLARRLEAEGTTFGAILDETRWSRAVRYLEEDGMPVEEVAFLLGFSQPTSFYRAFKRWTGKTPQQYRRRRRN